MKIDFQLNGKPVQAEIQADTMLLELVRSLGAFSVKRGCETSNCGLCTVMVEGKPVLSCSVPVSYTHLHGVCLPPFRTDFR